MPARKISVLLALGVVAGAVALVPAVHAARAADAPACTPAARVTDRYFPASPFFSYATAAPTPSFEGTGAERTLTVRGTGSVERPPDTAYLGVRLAATGSDAVSARCEVDRAYDALRAKLGPVKVQDAGMFPGASTTLSRATPPPAGTAPVPTPAPVWVSVRELRIVTVPGAELQNVTTAVAAVHGTVTSVQYGVTDREPAYEAALTSAMRDAAAQAKTIAAGQHARAGPVVRVDVAAIEWSSAGTSISVTPPLASNLPAPSAVAVNASVRATFPILPPTSGAQSRAALIVVHPSGVVSRLPELANLSVDFSDRDNDRTAMLYRHETAYDALWAKLRALEIDPRQVPNSLPQAVPNRTPGPTMPGSMPVLAQPHPSASPTPYAAFVLHRQVHVNAVPLAKLPAVIAAFAAAGATTAEVMFSVADRTAAVAAANADLRRNASLQANAVARAAGLRLVEPPYLQGPGYPVTDATITRTAIGSPDQPRRFEPPARLEGSLSATVVYAATR